MEQLKLLFERLSLKQRISILLVAAGVVAGVMYVMQWAKEGDFRPLFASLAAEDAGAIVQKLKESGVEYRVSADGGSILVPSSRVSELRLEMAGAGIPKTGRIGFELFDKTNLGLTDFTEHINFRRALEGELERSIIGLSEVEQARVHITFPKESVFVESRQPGKASVLLKLRPGRALKPASITAISHLVASAVEGLQPETVAIVDMNGNLLHRPRRGGFEDDAGGSDSTLEYRQRLEKDMLQKINSTLEPLLGAEGFRASVSIDCDFSSGEQSEETFDPSKSVMVSSQKSEDVNNSGLTKGVPGTASNLPRATSRPAASESAFARRTESVQYQTSRLVKRLTVPKGNVKRISAAVLVDHHVNWTNTAQGMKKEIVPPSAEQIRVIRQVLTGVVGISAERGDQLIVEALPFESTLRMPAPNSDTSSPAPGPTTWIERVQGNRTLLWSIGGGVAAVLALLVGGVLMMRKKSRARRAEAVQVNQELPRPPAPTDGRSLAEPLSMAKMLAPSNAKVESLVNQVSTNLKTDSAMGAQVFRVWLQEEEA